MLIKLYNNLFALILTILAGVFLSKTGYIDGKLRSGLNRIIFSFTLPLYVFTSMQGSITRELLATSLYPLAFGAGLSLANGASGYLLSRLFRTKAEDRPLQMFMTMFGNNLYLALPLVTALFGTASTANIVLYSTGSDVVFWTLGVAVLARQRSLNRDSLRNLFNPTTIAMILGALAGLYNLELPYALGEAAGNIGGLTTPLALMLTGASLAEIKLSQRPGLRNTTALLLGKLLISPALAALAVNLLGLSGTLAQVLVLMASMPTIVRSIVLTEHYGYDSRQTALGVLATTIASFATIPLVLTLVLR